MFLKLTTDIGTINLDKVGLEIAALGDRKYCWDELRNLKYYLALADRRALIAALAEVAADLDYSRKQTESWEILANKTRLRAETAEAEVARLRKRNETTANAALKKHGGPQFNESLCSKCRGTGRVPCTVYDATTKRYHHGATRLCLVCHPCKPEGESKEKANG